jgi:CubicO group peptidase (beta-lactamase class C family)
MRLSFGFFLAAGLQIPGASHAQASQLAPSVMARIDSVFAMYDSRTSPGCATSVVREGQPVFEKGYGMSDLQHGVPITSASIFHVASISKQFAAMSMDDDVRKHIPEIPDFGKRITIRHLIHHTSGLRDQWQLLSLSGWRADDPKSESDILWLVGRQRALNFEPGAEHLYSNTGFTLLGTIVKRVTGKSLREFTTERIFAPLGMTNTHFHDDHTMIVPGRTSAYVQRQGIGRGGAAVGTDDYRISIPVFDNAGATSLFTTVQDMAKWERNFLSPTVGDSSTIAQMHQRGRLNSGTDIPYAFGLVHGQVRGLTTIGHGGSDAGYRADFLRFPDERTAFITLCNVGSADPGQLNRSVARIVLADRMTPIGTNGASQPVAVAEVPVDPETLRGFAGVYLDTRTETQAAVVFQPGSKTLHAGRGPDAPKLRHVGNNEFVVLGPNGDIQARYRFGPGTVTNMQSNIALERVGAPDASPTTLQGLVGRYRGEELDVDWAIELAKDSTLVLSRRRTPDQRLTPVYADGFAGGVGNIRFTRDSAGKVTGFLLTSGRIRHVRFDRR